MKKQQLLELFDEVLKNWKSAESFVIQETSINEDDYDYEDLEEDIQELRDKFLKALND